MMRKRKREREGRAIKENIGNKGRNEIRVEYNKEGEKEKEEEEKTKMKGKRGKKIYGRMEDAINIMEGIKLFVN